MNVRKKDFKEGTITDVEVRHLKMQFDSRGWLVEIFRMDELDGRFQPVMAYVSESLPGVTRGPHEHVAQTDYFCFLGPSTFEFILWDNRPSSKSYWFRQTIVINGGNPCVVIVPGGVVHAYKNIGDKPGRVINCPNTLYAGWGRNDPIDEIRHEDDPDSPFLITSYLT